jgi:hypothetical protein
MYFMSSLLRRTRAAWRQCTVLAVMMLASALAHAQVSYQGMWWVAAESGWGMNLAHQGDVIVAAWYTYDTDGKPLWLITSTIKQGDGSYTGTLFRYTGKPLAQISGGSATTGSTNVGSVTLRFPTADTATLNYTFNGVAQQKNMTRYNFSTPPTCSFTTGSLAGATNYTDLWWNAQESGWGINLVHQSDVIVTAWYTYAADGRAMWLIGSPGRGADGSYSGTLFRASIGTPLLQINGMPSVQQSNMQNVGSIKLRFTDGQTATMEYTVDGATQTKTIQRFAFSSPRTICNVPNSNPNPGTGSKCFPDYHVGDRLAYRSTSQLGAFPQTTDTMSEHVVATTTWEGHPVFVIEARDAQGRPTSRSFFEQTATELIQWHVDTYDPATGQKNGSVRYSPEFRTPRNLNLNETVSRTFDTITSVTQQGVTINSTARHQHTTKLIGNESVTVPAGTFGGACKLEVRDVVSEPTAGTFTIDSIVWAAGSHGKVKATTVTPTTFGNVNSVQELTSGSVNGVIVP